MIPVDDPADDGSSFARLLTAIHTELAALGSGDAERIETATVAKLAALEAARAEAAAGFPPARAEIEAARDLNAAAQSRAAQLATHVDRRLAQLTRSSGRSAPLCYGADGRL